MKISEKIIILRKRLGYSQEDLANELDISRQSVYKWETDTAVPDLTKIKKLAKLFNISFDKLLDDSIDITLEPPVVENVPTPVPTPTKKGFRKVFVSNLSLKHSQAELDNGYPENRKRRNKSHTAVYINNLQKMKKFLKEMGATSNVQLQDDLVGCYFENSEKKTFGFYYNGAIQFLCPYENFININVSNSGTQMGYNRQMVVGTGFGNGGINSIGVGSIATPTMKKPDYYYLCISYFNEKGDIKEFKLSINCHRVYPYYEEKTAEIAKNMIELTSEYTARRMSDIQNKLSAIPAIIPRIQSGEIIVDEIDIAKINEKHKAQVKAANEQTRLLALIAQNENKQKRIRNLIILGVIVAIIAIALISNAISKSNEQKNRLEQERQVALSVVEKINEIGEVTLDDATLLALIKTQYSNLTESQKKYVTNYSVYTSAQQQFDVLYKQYMDEQTANDPTRKITLSDLNGTWESDKYRIIIKDLNGGKSVWYYTYNKYTGSASTPGIISSNLPSSTIESYNSVTKTKSGKLYTYNALGGSFKNYTIKIVNGDYKLTVDGVEFTKNK